MEFEFDWDEANVGHLKRHGVSPSEAEEVILGAPIDMGMEIIAGEERYLNLGITKRDSRTHGCNHVARAPCANSNGL